MLAKCHTCKCDIVVKTPQTKSCDDCRKKKRKESDAKYRLEHRDKSRKSYKKCRVCFKEFESFDAKIFCSGKCRNFAQYFPSNFKRREQNLEKRRLDLEELKIKYAHLL